jgi:hypothetical protein
MGFHMTAIMTTRSGFPASFLSDSSNHFVSGLSEGSTGCSESPDDQGNAMIDLKQRAIAAASPDAARSLRARVPVTRLRRAARHLGKAEPIKRRIRGAGSTGGRFQPPPERRRAARALDGLSAGFANPDNLCQ